MHPLVSVVIPGYKSKYILETIESVLAQTFTDFEIIVVDDGSPYDLKKVLAEYIDEKKIKYIFQENQKMAAARNNGIRNATGTFIAFIDDDDLWEPEKLKKQIECFSDSTVGLVYTFAEGFTENGPSPIANFEVGHEGKIYEQIFLADFIANSSVMIRKSAFEEQGGFNINSSYFGVDDADMWTRITYRYNACVVKEKLTRIRLHNEQFSGDKSSMYRNDFYVRTQLFKELSVSKAVRKLYYQRIFFEMAYDCRKTKKVLSAKLYIKSLWARPSLKTFFAIVKLVVS